MLDVTFAIPSSYAMKTDKGEKQPIVLMSCETYKPQYLQALQSYILVYKAVMLS